MTDQQAKFRKGQYVFHQQRHRILRVIATPWYEDGMWLYTVAADAGSHMIALERDLVDADDAIRVMA